MSTPLAPDRLQEFDRLGATVLRGVFADWVDTLRAGVAANMADPDPTARIYKSEDGSGEFFIDYCNWARIPDYRDFIFNSPAAEIGAQLMQSQLVQLFHEHVLVKAAASPFPTPWHQDAPYYCVQGPKTLSLWIPLDEVPRATTLEFIAGSHKWGKSYRPQRFDGTPLNADDGLEELPDIEADRAAFDIIGWAVSPGDAIAFDYRTVHGAPANPNGDQRRAFSLRLVGDDARFARRPGLTTSPPFPKVTLQDGDRLRGEDFPILLGG